MSALRIARPGELARLVATDDGRRPAPLVETDPDGYPLGPAGERVIGISERAAHRAAQDAYRARRRAGA